METTETKTRSTAQSGYLCESRGRSCVRGFYRTVVDLLFGRGRMDANKWSVMLGWTLAYLTDCHEILFFFFSMTESFSKRCYDSSACRRLVEQSIINWRKTSDFCIVKERKGHGRTVRRNVAKIVVVWNWCQAKLSERAKIFFARKSILLGRQSNQSINTRSGDRLSGTSRQVNSLAKERKEFWSNLHNECIRQWCSPLETVAPPAFRSAALPTHAKCVAGLSHVFFLQMNRKSKQIN